MALTPAEIQRAYRQRHPERVRQERRMRRARTKPWRTRAHKASVFAHGSNVRAVEMGVAGLLTATDVRAIDGPCTYCGGPAMGWDHVIPMARGGLNVIENITSCCETCNKRKWVRTPEEWAVA